MKSVDNGVVVYSVHDIRRRNIDGALVLSAGVVPNGKPRVSGYVFAPVQIHPPDELPNPLVAPSQCGHVCRTVRRDTFESRVTRKIRDKDTLAQEATVKGRRGIRIFSGGDVHLPARDGIFLCISVAWILQGRGENTYRVIRHPDVLSRWNDRRIAQEAV